MIYMKRSVRAAKEWINALNSGDIDVLLRVSGQDIAIAGPKGVAKGEEALRMWYMNTHLTFDLRELLACGNQVIALGTAHWHDGRGAEVGKVTTVFLMEISDAGHVVALSRHDEGLSVALTESGTLERSAWQTTKFS